MNINEPIQKGISQNTIDDIIDKTQKVAVKEFAEKLKKRLNLLYDWQYAKVDLKTIDELLKEYEK